MDLLVRGAGRRLVVRVRGSSPGLGSLRRMAPVRRCVALRAGLRRGALWRSHPARGCAPSGERRVGSDVFDPC